MGNKIKITEAVAWQDITPGGDIYAGGNSIDFKTGDWRTHRPVFNSEKCIHCLLCVPVCPDTSIPVKDDKRLEYDYDHCKGCGICASVCPVKCIQMVPEGEV